jgi:8-oxo-dGTP pyrophosphatase MutT (NUDIX family)
VTESTADTREPTGREPPLRPRRGVVAVVTRGAELLVIRRSQLVAAPGAFCFPGGGIEAGEDERQAVVRELREELAAEVRPYRRMWECTTAWQVHLAWWRCELLHEAIVPCEAEVASVHWLTPGDLACLPGLLESNQRFLQALAEGRISL